MMKGIKDFARAIVKAVATWVSLIAILFVNYNWDVFVQFIRNFGAEALITLLIPTFVAGLICMKNWPRRKKS